VLNCDRSTVKHPHQNTQNDCHHWLSHSSRVQQIRFCPGLHPGPHWRSLQRSHTRSRRSPSWFKGGPTSKGRGGKGIGESRREEDGGNGRKGEGREGK